VNFQLTVVMVSHDVPAVFQVSDRVAFLHNGLTHLNGTVDEVMAADDEVFKRFLAGKASGADEEGALAG
jgi:phospholipid/cholesterol/gamma-HCH transport system ATP-binding protein